MRAWNSGAENIASVALCRRSADIPVRSKLERNGDHQIFTTVERSGVAADWNVRAPCEGVLRREFQVSDAEDGAFGGVGEGFDFPAVGQHNLLDDCQAQSCAGLLGGEVGFENLGALIWRDAG